MLAETRKARILIGIAAATSQLLPVHVAQPSEAQRAPLPIFAQLGFSQAQVDAITAGRPTAKVLSWGQASEIYVFGAVHVAGRVETYLRLARDVRRLASAPGYLGVGELPEDATVDDLSGLVLDADDVKALKSCRVDDCDVQLPAAPMQAFRDQVDWKRADALQQVNAIARPMILKIVQAYRAGGDRALGEYRDKDKPARVADQFATLVEHASALPDVLPELRRYLVEFPSAPLPGGDPFFYWENVDFGMKPTLRVNHGVIYRARAGDHDVGAVAIKQLYATHYFHTALDLSVCVSDPGSPDAGFYLLTLKGSEQDGLTGVKGSILRKIVVDRTRTGLEGALASIKQRVEQSTSADR